MTEIEFENYIEDGHEFIVFQSRFGLYNSRDKEGNDICTSPTKEDCILWSREHLNGYRNSSCYQTNVKVSQDSLA